jgi:hypothetical protein
MSTIGWIVVAVVVVVVLAALAAWWRSQRRARLSERAHALRGEARGHAADIGSHRKVAREAAVRADEARAEADEAQRVADDARRALAQEEAVREDKLREADRVDPAVDHRADDYRPTDGDGPTDDARPDDGSRPAQGGSHRADG